MLIFSPTPGVVGAVISGPALPFGVIVGGNPGVPVFPDYRLAKGVVTGFEVEGQSGLGVSHTLRDRIYLYVFGERAGTAVVSGMAFANVCGPGATLGDYTGFDVIYSYYERVRVSTAGLAVSLVFGPYTALAGFMHKLSFRLEDPATGLGSFSFRFVTVPRNTPFDATPPPLPWRRQGGGIEAEEGTEFGSGGDFGGDDAPEDEEDWNPFGEARGVEFLSPSATYDLPSYLL
jgi:hypothetical protein